MDPNEINLESMGKMFEYEKQSRMIDEIRDIDEIREIAKSYMKLFLKQQEVLRVLPGI